MALHLGEKALVKHALDAVPLDAIGTTRTLSSELFTNQTASNPKPNPCQH